MEDWHAGNHFLKHKDRATWSDREVQELLLDLVETLITMVDKMDADFTKLDASISDISTKFDDVETALTAATAANSAGNSAAVQAAIDEATAHLAVLQGHVDTVTTIAQAAPSNAPQS